MKIQKETLYFVGHEGQMQTLNAGHTNTMYILDSNLVLSLIQANQKSELSGKHKHFLSISKQAIISSWHQKKQWIPINPIMALMELTKQNVISSYDSYIKLHTELFEDVYKIQDVAPEWVADTYFSALNIYTSTYPSIVRIIEAVYYFCPPDDKPLDSDVIKSCEMFFDWILANRNNLTFIGGPLMYIATYAFCGSPQARSFIKFYKRSEKTSKNVAYDFMYWIVQEISYHKDQYENTIVCTSDQALAELLASRVNRGPRGQIDSSNTTDVFEVYGDFSPIKFKRLENTKLENEILKKFLPLLTALGSTDKNTMKFRFNENPSQ